MGLISRRYQSPWACKHEIAFKACTHFESTCSPKVGQQVGCRVLRVSQQDLLDKALKLEQVNGGTTTGKSWKEDVPEDIAFEDVLSLAEKTVCVAYGKAIQLRSNAVQQASQRNTT